MGDRRHDRDAVDWSALHWRLDRLRAPHRHTALGSVAVKVVGQMQFHDNDEAVISMTQISGGTDTVETKKRRLRFALRQARINALMTQKAVAKELLWSVSKVVRLEQGTVPVAPTDVRVLLQLYQITDESRISELVQLAREIREDRGWSRYSDVLSAGTIELYGNEPTATVIYRYEPNIVPGLFQTQAYAHSLLEALGKSREEIEARLEVYEVRRRLLDKPVRPDIHVILGETALSRAIGSTEVMREQIDHLRELAAADGISLHLLPFSAGAHKAMDDAFTVLQFSNPLLTDLVSLEGPEREAVNYEDESYVRRYLDYFAELERLTINGDSMEAEIQTIFRERIDVFVE